MSADTQTFEFQQFVKVPPAAVYHAFSNATALQEWFCDVATVLPRAGGRFYCAWNSGFYACGEFLAVEPEKRLRFTWFGREEPAPGEVEVRFEPQAGGTLVQVAQSGVGTSPDWEKAIGEISKGWSMSMENLASVLETGQDLRFTRRPMLGIAVTDFNEEIAKNLGVPVSQGIRLDSVLEGMGAAAAGLRGGDVVVMVDGKETVDWGSLAAVLQAHRAGETVEVIFYRGPEKHSTAMTLSGRPLPDMPESLAALAELVRKRMQETDAQLDAFLDTITDGEADHHPAPGEWSVKQILAHLLHGERGYQQWIDQLVVGFEPHFDDWGGNLNARVVATVAAWPTLADLRGELKRAGAETVALFENLPAEFFERKGSFWRLAYGETQGPAHLNTHLEQMRAAVASARGK